MEDTLAGKLLISHPSVSDPFLKNLVMIVLENEEHGSVALCINKESGSTVMDLMLQNDKEWIGDDILFVGGPKNENSLFLLHSGEWESENTHNLNDEISISSDYKMSDLMMEDGGPDYYRFIVGVMSWPPKQLETEIEKHNKWIVTEAEPEVVWERSGVDQWEYAIEEYSRTVVDKFFK